MLAEVDHHGHLMNEAGICDADQGLQRRGGVGPICVALLQLAEGSHGFSPLATRISASRRLRLEASSTIRARAKVCTFSVNDWRFTTAIARFEVVSSSSGSIPRYSSAS